MQTELEISIKSLDEFKLENTQLADFKNLIRLYKKSIEEVDAQMLERAFKLCYISHRNITRASGEPYDYHPLEVAKIVATEIPLMKEKALQGVAKDKLPMVNIKYKKSED